MFDSFFQSIADAAGAPVDYIKLFVCLLSSFPLASVYPRLSSPNAKHLFSLAVSTIFFVPILELRWGFLQLLATSLVTYYICLNRIGGRNMGWLVFGLQMGHLTCNHVYRQFGNIPLTTIEITSMQMVSTMNLTTFAWDCFDGQIRSAEECDDSQKKTRITEMPSLLEFLGYIFYAPGVLIGPSTRFADYRAWSDGSLFASLKGKEKTNENGQRLPPGRNRAACLELAVGLGFMAIYSTIAPKYGYERLIGANGGFEGYKWYQRILYVQTAGFMARTKYYGIWSLTNGACVLSGLGFYGIDPVSGKTKWNRCRNIDIPRIEFANNWKELLDAWNMNTNVWLRNNVYKRIARPGKKPGFKSTMTTFLTSAFWHGLAPGYYLSFFLAGFMQSAARTLRKHMRPLFFQDTRAANPKLTTLGDYTVSQLLYCGASIVAVQLTLNYAVAPFMLLDFGASIQGWRSVYFYGHLVTGVCLVAFHLGAGKYLDRLSGRPSKRTKEAGAGFATGYTTGADSDTEAAARAKRSDDGEAELKREAEKVSSLAPKAIS
ncbi:Lysophospholipid acyltransferase [Thecaphora frezii]